MLFSVSIEMIIFSPLFVNVMNYIDWFQMVNQPCILEINLTCLGHIIVLSSLYIGEFYFLMSY